MTEQAFKIILKDSLEIDPDEIKEVLEITGFEVVDISPIPLEVDPNGAFFG